jgi:AcrR family transcriptional regulator
VPPEGLSPVDYYDAAFGVLAERGPSGLTIAALCQRLGVTKGSFYHHFNDLPTFNQGLLEHWASEHATRLIALSESITDSAERFELLQGIAVGLPHDAEAAIRAWSWSDPMVADVVHRVDQARLAHLTAAGMDAGRPEDQARLLATISLATLIGMQQLERPTQRRTMEHIFSELRARTFDAADDVMGSPSGS